MLLTEQPAEVSPPTLLPLTIKQIYARSIKERLEQILCEQEGFVLRCTQPPAGIRALHRRPREEQHLQIKFQKPNHPKKVVI